ncbi:hypothetical protein OHT57_10985 [Streptomyces sp. NBC_00285]|uniref:hypothetical protein n=1 Tax=Streptomyces sp. NBC_00285 TaxID=2975700 RepID=UPI002E2B7AAA|nr:hypothetical protein [Streptomyces sp. NBC_00285]
MPRQPGPPADRHCEQALGGIGFTAEHPRHAVFPPRGPRSHRVWAGPPGTSSAARPAVPVPVPAGASHQLALDPVDDGLRCVEEAADRGRARFGPLAVPAGAPAA